MRKLAMGLAVGGAALAMSAEAGACSYRDINNASEPIMATLVRDAHSIALARVTFVDALPPSQRQFGPNVETHEYVFEVDRYLKGEGPRFFNYRASSPFPPARPDHCDGFELEAYDAHARNADCLSDRMHQATYARAIEVAESGRDDWERFFWIAPFHHNGQGGISPPEQGGGDCSWAESYEVGQSYLVFRDAGGGVIQTHGLNLQLITREDDHWLAAVEYFLANPEQGWLPAISPESFLNLYSFAAVGVYRRCPAFRPRTFDDRYPSSEIGDVEFLIRGQDESRIPTSYSDFRNGGSLTDITDCPEGGRYLFLDDDGSTDLTRMPYISPLPIRDGMVDLSGIPSQYRIEPIEVALEDVISWLSEEAETE